MALLKVICCVIIFITRLRLLYSLPRRVLWLTLFITKRLRSACAHDTYHWPKQLLPWIQMSRFSGHALRYALLHKPAGCIINTILISKMH